MASHFHYGISGNPTASMLTYPMKSLNLGPAQTHHLDLCGGPINSGTLGFLGYNRPLLNSGGETSPNSNGSCILRGQDSKTAVFSEFHNPQLGLGNPGVARVPAICASGFSSATSFLAAQNSPFRLNDRLGSVVKTSDADDLLPPFCAPLTVTSASRVLSSLQGFRSTVSPDVSSAFALRSYNSTGGDSFCSDGSLSLTDGLHSDSPQTTTVMSSLESILSSPPPFTPLLPSPTKPNPQSFQTHTLGTSSSTVFPLKAMDLSPVTKSTTEHTECSVGSTQYYTSRQLDSTRDLQASGTLKAASWILVPPVPEGTAAHLRTGRVHEFKSRACSDRIFNASYMDHELKQVLQNKVQACLFTSDDSSKEKLPRNIGAYTDLVPLEVLHPARVSVTFGLPTVCFKAWSPRFNRPMLLRRIILPGDHEAALSPDAYMLAKQLSDADHPVVVGFRDVFFTDAFNDNSAVVVYEYTPCSSTLQQTHMSDPMKLTSFSSPFNITRTVRPHSALKSGPSDLGMLPESTVWSYLVQLIHGLRFIHQQVSRSCGILDPTKVLIQGGTRLRINCFGLKDVLFPKSHEQSLAEDQANDFVQLGKLIIGSACGTAESVQTTQRVTLFNLLQRTYRPELVTLLRGLISGQFTGVDQLMRATAPFVYDQLTFTVDHSDFLERQLFVNMECDRLFRLVCKLQSIVERSDRHDSNPDWSETGDRYMLKLFRDFLFHQNDHLGAPYLDLAHVISTLNKVEAGSTERLCLASRDSQNVIIVTYADIKQWLDTSFSHLVERHRQSRCEMQLAQQQESRQQPQQVAVAESSHLSNGNPSTNMPNS